MNLPPTIPTPAGEPPTSYPNYSPSNGLGTISSNSEGGLGINEYGMIMFKNLQTGVAGQILLNAEGITKNTDPTIEWGSISTALENIVAVVPPPDSTTLEVNDKIIITDGASNQLTFSAIDNSISATTNLTVAPITTFNQNVKSILPPQAPEDLINLAYLQTFPPASQLDLFLNYDSFPTPPIDTYSLLSGVDITPATTNQTTITHGGSPVFITGFANQIANLTVGSYIPAGIWNMSLFCNVTTSTPIGALNIFWRLYGRTSLGIETQISGDSSLFNLITIAPVVVQTAMSLGIPETDLTPFESLVVKIYGTISSGSRIVNTYYEGDHQYSYVKTSFGVYVPPSILTTSNTWTGFNTFNNGIESNGTTSITGALYDSVSLAGTAGQLLSSTGSAISWVNPASTPTIAQVLTAGNVSTNQSITGLDNITATTLNSTDCTIDNLLDATSITTNAIAVKNSQSWSSGGVIVANTNVICPNFTGLASKATTVAGGLGGQVLYQSAVDTTAKLANGTAGKYLKTNGTTLAPSWDTPPLYFPEVIVANSAAVMGGSSYPQIPTTAQSNTGYDGWCFVNSTAGTKISWNLGALSPTSILGDYKGWFFCFTIIEATSRPFLNVYTLPATAPNWYNSRRTFITSDPTSTPLVVNTPYIAYWRQDTSYPIPTRYGHTPFPLVMADGYVGARIGAFANTETYYFMTVSTNSGSAVNSENFIVSQAGNVLANGIEPFSFLGSAVATANATNIANGLGGQVLYQSAVNTTAKLANGTAGYVLTANGTTLAPSWNAPSAGATPTIAQVLTSGNVSSNQSITGLNNVSATTFTGLASSATNIANGLGGQVLYQSAVDTTAKLANGTAGKYLKTNGTTLAPSWDTPPLYFPAITMSNSSAVMGGSSYPQIPTTAQSNTGYDGWCFTNTTAGSAISWAMGGRSPTSILGDYKGWYFCFMINVATATPFLNVYTLPATAPNFFNSRRTFITSGTGATPLVVGTPYIAYWQQDTSYPIPSRYGHTPFPLEMATGYVGAQIGAFANTETYYFMTVGSNSGSVVNTQSFIVSEAANVFANGIEPYQFLGSSVATPNSTNIIGGLGGSIPYQSAVNTTSLLANGASTYVLQSNGTTLAPSWVETVAKAASAQLALVSQRLAFGNAGSIPYQTAPNQTSFIVNGTAGYVLTANGGTLAPTWNASSAGATPTIAQVLTSGSVSSNQSITGLNNVSATTFTGLASSATNIAGGLGGSIPYQSAVNTTALLANGSVGQVLTANGGTVAPSWQNAGASSSAANLIGGDYCQIPYQSAPNTTLFTPTGTQNQVLVANNSGGPSWENAVLLPAYGLCSFRTNNYTQTVGIGFGQTSYINNAVLTTQYISAFGVTFPAGNYGQFVVVNGGAYTVNIRVNLQSSGAILSSAQLFLYSVTGAAIVLGTIQNYQYSTASATSNIVMEVNTIVPLVSATTYQVGFIQNYTGTISGVVINFCYISINRIF